jgi:GT2 family glycosyltransferase
MAQGANVAEGGGGVVAPPPDVSVVVVSFNTRDVLEACLRALLSSEGVRLEVFVVDNASTDGSAHTVERRFPAVTLLKSPHNRGFAAANNLAIPRSRGRYILLLNPDTVVERGTVATLAEFLDLRPEVGIAGPRVLNADGSLQSCGYWYPTLLREVRLSKNVDRFLRAVLGESRPDPDPTRPTKVDWVDGCCLMIRRRVIEQIGLLDEQFFLYAEELDWCRSARKAGWEIMTCPAAQMTHLRGTSTEQVKDAALAALVETRLQYYRKHDGLSTAFLVSLVYAAGCVRRWGAEPRKNRAKLAGIRRWWSTGLRRRSGPASLPGCPPPASRARVA